MNVNDSTPGAAPLTRRRDKAVMAVLLAAIAMFPSPVRADMVKAEDVAYRMATSYVAKSFNLSPTMQSSILAGGQFVRYTIPVARGVDYVILVGTDDAVLNTGIYVYDEVGGLILDDIRGKSRAGVQFRSSYSGSVYAYVYAARVRGAFGALAVLVGRRGSERTGTAFPENPNPGPKSDP
jgi:hypothetical protein